MCAGLLLVMGLVLGTAGPVFEVAAKPHKRQPDASRSVARPDRSAERAGEAKQRGRSGRVAAESAADALSVQQATASAAANALIGTGLTISNIAFTGAPAALGSFTTGDADLIGFASGVILSSGFASNVVGPNQSDSITGDNEQAGDSDLDTLLDPGDDPTEDAAVLEFDFVPAGNTVSFRYVFGSDEYLEYVEEGFNDVFGFFVNGQNCALVNDAPISVDSINPDSNPDFYRDNENGALNTEMDGLTTVLTCVADVTPQQSNHLKLAIGDVGDSILDSNVFIRTGSFSVGEPQPPVCTHAVASPAFIDAVLPKKRKKGKNKKKKPIPFVDIFVNGVTDPNGDDPRIEITGILQDEAVGPKPDGSGVGSGKARVRREAAKNGDGRIYRIGFEAEDDQNDTCIGSVDVGVRLKGKTPAGNPTIDATQAS